MNPETGPRSALDQRLDGAASRVEHHVADYVTPQFDPSARPPRRSSATAATAMAAALLLVVGIVAFNGGDPDDGVDVAEPNPEIIDGAVAGPRDGLDSLRLPIEVTPSEGLADGQVVTVRGSQFPPGRQLGVVMCAGYQDAAPGGSDNCQLSPYTSVTTDENGNFEVLHAVDRVFTTSGGEQIDCAEAVEGRVCVVAVGALDDYDQSGIAPVSFDGSIPPLPDPVASVSVQGPYTDGQTITITVQDLEPGTPVFSARCASNESVGSCEGVDVGQPAATADDTGRASFEVVLRRKVDLGNGAMDCADTATTWCSIDVSAGPNTWSFDLPFVGSPDSGTTATTAPSTTDTTEVPGSAPPPKVIETPMTPTTTTTSATTTTSGG